MDEGLGEFMDHPIRRSARRAAAGSKPRFGRPTALLEVLSPEPRAVGEFLSVLRTQLRYLLGRSKGTTAIILSGGSLAYIAEAARTARALQPSMVIVEDCDLIAEDRSFGHGPQPLLFEVLDAMDGLDDDADVAFILTTNRVDMLERVLAQRPGRMDLAVEIPLPEVHERAALSSLRRSGEPT